jgi:hypothetical protein
MVRRKVAKAGTLTSVYSQADGLPLDGLMSFNYSEHHIEFNTRDGPPSLPMRAIDSFSRYPEDEGNYYAIDNDLQCWSGCSDGNGLEKVSKEELYRELRQDPFIDPIVKGFLGLEVKKTKCYHCDGTGEVEY